MVTPNLSQEKERNNEDNIVLVKNKNLTHKEKKNNGADRTKNKKGKKIES